MNGSGKMELYHPLGLTGRPEAGRSLCITVSTQGAGSTPGLEIKRRALQSRVPFQTGAQRQVTISVS